jgi:hypothetical protein
MPFKCSLCELDIQVGEPILADERMNLAHQSCVERKQRTPGSTVVVASASAPIPILQPPSPPPAPQVVEVKIEAVSGFGFGNPTASLGQSAPPLCAECGKSAIAICPYCGTRVHQDYGYAGLNCSGRHEGKCPGARESRDPKYTVLPKGIKFSSQTVPLNITIEPGVISGNGKHAAPKPKKGRTRR